ncbi:hypothetical protein SAMN06296036_10562 [Pseudobacteriovorax antillogorgiicola]|uniref:Uncharacterized protein n=1 Tax=Pseudobacteriovorax antillogorgiicola TaxID=1513793 RepID=A0A1Y6BMZ7_9BACT|nr:hypothetical protein EDD56_105262 [Pseudobacteriovorax antillogorgiicola]SMF11201.1 hypothetical protein SAMN06296036_10562 [Pseudobacteriovorax antillogorgiicola]
MMSIIYQNNPSFHRRGQIEFPNRFHLILLLVLKRLQPPIPQRSSAPLGADVVGDMDPENTDRSLQLHIATQ